MYLLTGCCLHNQQPDNASPQQDMSDDYLNNVLRSSKLVKDGPEAAPTRAESLGHQPRQAAGDLGPGEVIVIEALDGRDDEGPSHPSVICRISHL